MEHKDKKLNLDLDFLGENAPAKSEKKKHYPKDYKPEAKKEEEDKSMSGLAKSLIGAGIITIVVIGIGWASSENSSPTEAYTTETRSTLPPPKSMFDEFLDTETVGSSSSATIAKNTKTTDQICKDEYGSQSYSTGDKNTGGGPVCDCNAGYKWNDSRTECILIPKVKTSLEICQDRNGYNVTYDSTTNSCTCASGYSLSATSDQCVDSLQARDDNCIASYPNTSFLKYDTTTGKNVCDCKSGYDWNNDRTACYTTTEFSQSCVNTYGQGSYSTTQGGKRVCDCTYGYDWDLDRKKCITTASINSMCERDVGRNSHYSGTVANGKYQCTEPY